jgi:putative RNA 2'-phosphotransferase
MKNQYRGIELAYLLRHDKNYQFDEHGYRDVDDLIKNHGYTFEEIQHIVDTNNKKRFEFNEDKTKIRARQGHSVNVDVELTKATLPDILYHGTALKFIPNIKQIGITSQQRLYVHLSNNINTALSVAKRHGSPVVLKINCKAMVKDGIDFYLSNNGVWLTKVVDPQYILNKDL